ncbi:MAG: hypothetical protein NT031_01160 [Planctomycetota bacterium]|nr:hypothetical protein [Planctomycetota bacterium]
MMNRARCALGSVVCAIAGYALATPPCTECWHYVTAGCPLNCEESPGGSYFIGGHFVLLERVYDKSYDVGWYRECTGDRAADTDDCDPDQTWYVCEAHDTYASPEDCADEVNAVGSGFRVINGPQALQSAKCAWEEIVIE